MGKSIISIIEKSKDTKIAFALFLIAFSLRALFATLSYFVNEIPETNIYYDLAKEIVYRGHFLYIISDPSYDIVGPMLPWLNALTIKIFGDNYLAIYIITAFGSGLITYFTYKTSRLFLNKKTSLIAGCWSAIYLLYFHFTPSPGKDIWMSFFMIFLLYKLCKLFIINDFNLFEYLLFIVVYAISFHLDERFLLLAPLLLLYIFLYETKGYKSARAPISLIFIVLVMALLLPWTIRNYIKHEKIVLISTRTQGFTDRLFGYNEPLYDGTDFMNLYGEYYIHDNQIDSVIHGLKTMTDGGYVISKEQRAAMSKGLLPHPFSRFETIWVNTKEFIRPFQINGEYQKTGYFYYEKSKRHNLISIIFYGSMLFFSLPGSYFLLKRNKDIFFICLVFIIYYTLIHSFFVPFTTWRYRLPLDSIFIIMGCYGITMSYDIIITRLKKLKK